MTLLPGKKNVPALSTVTQAGSTVLGNQVGGNFNQTNNYQSAQNGATVIEKLLAHLQDEVEKELHCSEMLIRLQRYHGGKALDGIKGLEAKLVHAGRADELEDALERKESFSKLLESWSLYSSAQEIFAHLLAKAEHLFNSEILPDIGTLQISEVNRRVNQLIVEPTVHECGASLFKIDHYVAMGMVYWLTEQCFVKWH
jgi:hypothetical protein